MYRSATRRHQHFGPAEAERALAHHLPRDRRELSGDRRGGGLAQSRPPSAHDAVAGLRAQRHVGPGALRADLCATHLRRPPAHGDGLAAVRRRPARGRRPDRGRAPGHRGADRGAAREGVRAGADRGRRDDLGPFPLRRRRARRQAGGQAQACRVRGAGARQGAGGDGRRGPGRGEPGHHAAARSAALEPRGGHQLPQCPHPGPHACGGQGQDREGAGDRRPSSTP